MSKLRCFISMSLDGFVAGPNQSAEDPLGVGGLQLHEWTFPLWGGASGSSTTWATTFPFEQVDAIEAPGVAHLRYRLLN